MFFSESEKQISYLEENYLKPLRDAEAKANRILLPLKDRKTLHKIYGIIETNSSYLTSNNEIAGKEGFRKRVKRKLVEEKSFCEENLHVGRNWVQG